MDGWMDRWMDGWMDKLIDRFCYILQWCPVVPSILLGEIWEKEWAKKKLISECSHFRENFHCPSLSPGWLFPNQAKSPPSAASHLWARVGASPLVRQPPSSWQRRKDLCCRVIWVKSEGPGNRWVWLCLLLHNTHQTNFAVPKFDAYRNTV